MGEVAFDRATLVKGMPLRQFESAFQKHDIPCEREGETATHEVKLQIQPKVTFSQGKAVKATLNWGKMAPPRLAKTACGVQRRPTTPWARCRSVVDDINGFIHTRCKEPKEKWRGKQQRDFSLGAPPLAPRTDLACAVPARARLIRAKGAAFHDDRALLDSERHSDWRRHQHHLA